MRMQRERQEQLKVARNQTSSLPTITDQMTPTRVGVSRSLLTKKEKVMSKEV